jgi:hypothetical protein
VSVGIRESVAFGLVGPGDGTARVISRAFRAGVIAWAALLPLAPFAAVQPPPAHAWYPLGFALYDIGRFICHQRPERSFFLWAVQMPVCARCTGIYVGAALAAAMLLTGVPPDATSVARPPSAGGRWAARLRGPRGLLALAALPTVFTVLVEWTTGAPTSNVVRAVAGVPLGALVAVVVARAIESPGGAAPVGSARADVR